LLTGSAVTALNQGDDYGVMVSRGCGLDVHQATIVACLLTGEPGTLPRKLVKTFSAMTEGVIESRDCKTTTSGASFHITLLSLSEYLFSSVAAATV
jgi:hypothetical protein